MRERPRATVSELRTAIACLPRTTRIAMLEGISRNDIVVGAYTHEGGICPMLAAHRAGGRTNFITFARAWDRFAFRSGRRRKARRASERELLVLRTQLEASLLEDDVPARDLREAIREHRELRERSRPRPGDSYRGRELRRKPGWAWTRLFRRYDDYERTLRRLQGPPGRQARPPRPVPRERAAR
jgi:hypothetical protein